MYAESVLPDMAKERTQTRVEQDTQEAITNYAEEVDCGESEAMRRLIRSGLAVEGHGVTRVERRPLVERLAQGRLVGIGVSGFIIGALLILSATIVGTTGAALAFLGFGVVATTAGTLTAAAAALAQASLAAPAGTGTEEVSA